MKIGILTIHFPYNYGAMLQTYALKHYLEKRGHETRVIDYRPYYIDKYYHFYVRSLVQFKRKFLNDILGKNRINRKMFNEFLTNQILDNGGVKTLKKTDWKQFDVLITGSDQVWNPHITGYDSHYLFDFIEEKKCQIISYAPSIAISSIDSKWSSILSNYLKRYDSISVREASSIEFLEKITNKEICAVLDPTFLIGKDEWEKIEKKPKDINLEEPYILLYQLQESDTVDKTLCKYKKMTGYKIISIHPTKKEDTRADVFLNDIGPSEFISLIHNATYVITNSFHGTVFSIIFEKPFITIKHTETGSRMQNLMDLFDLKADDNGCFLIKSHNKMIINKEIESSRTWLNNNIK